MEIRTSRQTTKEGLLQESEAHRNALNKEFNLLSEKSGKIITNSLIIGGALIGTYLLARDFFSSPKKPKKKKNVSQFHDEEEEISTPSIISTIGISIGNQLLLMLLNMAKEKLTDYIQEKNQQQEE